MPIDCPFVNQMIKVSNGTICATGTTGATTSAVFVRVFDGFLTPPPPNLNDVSIATSGTPATITGTKWKATNVPVPALGSAGNSAPGAPLTIISWELKNFPPSPGHPTVIIATSVVHFRGVLPTVPGATDCCGGSGSGSGKVPVVRMLEITEEVDLLISIPDGPHAGNHIASRSSHLLWTLQVGKHEFHIKADPGGHYLVLHGKSVIHSTSIQFGPFSATFPGNCLESSCDLVVVQS